jgi:hypothetical protein
MDQYYDRHRDECSSEDVAAYKNYAETRWSEDYGRPGFQLYYAYRLFERRVAIARGALSKYLDIGKDGTKVVSIGCGPGAELAAAHEVLQSQNVGFLGIDCERGWERLYRAWATRAIPRREFYWRTKKVTDENTLVKLLRVEKASVVIFSYFLCDFGNDLNPRRLMEQVRTLQQVIIFDNPNILGIDDEPSTNEIIYCDGYLDERPHGDSWKQRAQVLVYSRNEINVTLGFAITLRLDCYPQLALHAGHFKKVERVVASSLSHRTKLLVPFTAIHHGRTFRNDFVNFVAPCLADALNISVSAIGNACLTGS